MLPQTVLSTCSCASFTDTHSIFSCSISCSNWYILSNCFTFYMYSFNHMLLKHHYYYTLLNFVVFTVWCSVECNKPIHDTSISRIPLKKPGRVVTVKTYGQIWRLMPRKIAKDSRLDEQRNHYQRKSEILLSQEPEQTHIRHMISWV